MENNLFDNLVTIIIGDENSSLDGKIIGCNFNNNYDLTIDHIINTLSSIGYDLLNKSKFDINDKIHSMISNGHIVFINECYNNNYGYLYLPSTFTEKQIESFKSIENQIQNLILIRFIINKKNPEYFEKVNSYEQFIKIKKKIF